MSSENETTPFVVSQNDSDECCSPAIYDYSIILLLITISIFIGFVLNGLAIFLFFAYWRKLSKHMINWLMFNVAVTNLATIICSSAGLIIEEFDLLSDSRFVGGFFVVELNPETWKRSLWTILSIAFVASTYSMLAVSVERWWVISGRRRKAFEHELRWTVFVFIFVWIGAIAYGFLCTLIMPLPIGTQIYHSASAIAVVDILPSLVMCGFFVVSARCLLYSYGASDDFSTKCLRARNRRAHALVSYVVAVPLCVLPFTFFRVLYLFPDVDAYLQCAQFGQFLTHLVFVINRCLLQCANPTLLFMLSCLYRECAFDFLNKLRHWRRNNQADCDSNEKDFVEPCGSSYA